MSQRDEIVYGMAFALWAEASSGAPPGPDEIRSATKAAEDLAKLYEKVNNKSLAVIKVTIPGGRGWETTGRELAAAATGQANNEVMTRVREAITVPTFEIKLAGDELKWEGGYDNDEYAKPHFQPYHGPSEDYPIGYDQWTQRLQKAAALTGARIAYGKDTHDAWRAGKTPLQYAKEKARLIRKNPRKPHDVPHTKTVAETRAILAKIKKGERCDASCPGWIVAETDTDRGDEIEVCDECMQALPKAVRLSDDDVAQLPEAKAELAGTGSDPRYNPSSLKAKRAASFRDDGLYDVFDENGTLVGKLFRSPDDREWYEENLPGLPQTHYTERWRGSTQGEALASLERRRAAKKNPPKGRGDKIRAARQRRRAREAGQAPAGECKICGGDANERGHESSEWHRANLRDEGSSDAGEQVNPRHLPSINEMIAKFPAEFGLRGHEGKFRISRYDSYINDDRTGWVLYTERFDNGSWRAFAKGSEAELRREIVPSENPPHGSSKIFDYIRQATAEGSAASIEGISRSTGTKAVAVEAAVHELERSGKIHGKGGYYTAAGVKPEDWYR